MRAQMYVNLKQFKTIYYLTNFVRCTLVKGYEITSVLFIFYAGIGCFTIITENNLKIESSIKSFIRRHLNGIILKIPQNIWRSGFCLPIFALIKFKLLLKCYQERWRD